MRAVILIAAVTGGICIYIVSLHHNPCQNPVTAVKYLMRRNTYENILLFSEHSLRDFEYIPFVKKNLQFVQQQGEFQ